MSVLVFLIIITIGSFRDILFVNINNQLAFLNGDLKENYLLSYMNFLESFSPSLLFSLKWILTIGYTLAFYIIGRFVIKNIIVSTEGVKWYTYTYLFFICIAALFYLTGYAFGNATSGYSLSRSVMGALQSPIPLLIFLPFLLLKKEL